MKKENPAVPAYPDNLVRLDYRDHLDQWDCAERRASKDERVNKDRLGQKAIWDKRDPKDHRAIQVRLVSVEPMAIQECEEKKETRESLVWMLHVLQVPMAFRYRIALGNQWRAKTGTNGNGYDGGVRYEELSPSDNDNDNDDWEQSFR